MYRTLKWKLHTILANNFVLLTIFALTITPSHSGNEHYHPFVLLPSALSWTDENFIYVTPHEQNHPFVDISVKVVAEYSDGRKKENAFIETLRQRSSKLTTVVKIKFRDFEDTRPLKYYLDVEVSRHPPFSSVLHDSPNIKHIDIQTDKVFYRPSEKVKIRALPILANGSIYAGTLFFNLLDPNGFKIFNTTKQFGSGRFVSEYFELPRYLRKGRWKILASASAVTDRGKKFQTTFVVDDFALPKYHVLLNIRELSHDSLGVDLLARFSHGLLLNGRFVLLCSPIFSKNDDDPSISTIQASNEDSDNQAKRLYSGELKGGVWIGTINISNCFPKQEGENQQFYIKLTASVFEKETFYSGKAEYLFEPYASGFEIIPLQPAYTDGGKIPIYLRLINSILTGDSADIVIQCISQDKAVNGLNDSLTGQRLGTVVFIDVKPTCDAVVIRAHRKMSSGRLSKEELLVLPQIGTGIFDFSIIQPVLPLKVEYNEGEKLDIHLANKHQTFNYMLISYSQDGIEIVSVGSTSEGSEEISFVVSTKMRGVCILYVFNSQHEQFITDARVVMFQNMSQSCPGNLLDVELSSSKVRVGSRVGVTLHANPKSLLGLHIFDSCLDELFTKTTGIRNNKLPQMWTFDEFSVQKTLMEHSISMANFISERKIFHELRKTCKRAGRHWPQCPQDYIKGISAAYSSSRPQVSRLSQDCYRLMIEECSQVRKKNGELGTLAEEEPAVKMSSNSLFTSRMSAPMTIREKGEIVAENIRARQDDPSKNKENDQLILRDFFPEVWLFEDYEIGQSGSLELEFNAPHSITEWTFSTTMWAEGRFDVCQGPKKSIITQKHIFMDVDMPLHVYENETVEIRVLVIAENLNKKKQIFICMTGLNPLVCGDIGSSGGVGDNEQSRISLTPDSLTKEKKFFVKFLKAGFHNLTFELRDESTDPSSQWKCARDGNDESSILDRIIKIVEVDKRVDTELHFKQIVVYPRKHIHPKSEVGEVHNRVNNATLASESFSTRNMRQFVVRSTHHDVIDYMVESFETDEEKFDLTPLTTTVTIDAHGRMVYNIEMEFSRFVPSFPPKLLNGGGLRNRQIFTLTQNKKILNRTPRHARSTERKIRGQTNLNSFPNLLKELAFQTYELKALEAFAIQEKRGQKTIPEASETSSEEIDDIFVLGSDREWLERRRQNLGNLLSELLTYSDCLTPGRECGFGEFVKPKNSAERNFLFTTLATSLLCQQRVSDEFVCGPIFWLANMAEKIADGESINFGQSYQFDANEMDTKLFMETLLVQMATDCSGYSCASDMRDSWTKLHAAFFQFDPRIIRDLRTKAAIAYMSTHSNRRMMRSKLEKEAKFDQIPYWTFEQPLSGKQSTFQNVVEQSTARSQNILLNSLAILAYTSESHIYRYWKKKFDFEGLINWLVEEQDSDRQYENSLDTFFASRALYHYYAMTASWQIREYLMGIIVGNISSSESPLVRSFTAKEMPFIAGIPPLSPTTVHVATKGNGRMLLGIKALTQRRRRSRRDPNDYYPVKIQMVQNKIPNTGFLNQTVFLMSYLSSEQTVEIDHGLFTGFSTSPHLVQILSGSVHFLVEPTVSESSVHFVLAGLQKEDQVSYMVSLVEPKHFTSMFDLAPLSISVIRHRLVLGQLIISPESLGRSLEGDGNRVQRSQNRIQRSSETIPIVVLPTSDEDNQGQKHDEYFRANSTPSSTQSSMREMSPFVASRKSEMNEVIDTVCLQSGTCTCAESSCSIKCDRCSRLTFEGLCKEMNPEYFGQSINKFAVIFRIENRTMISRGYAKYMVMDLNIMDWKAPLGLNITQPRRLTIWIRECNSHCKNLMGPSDESPPRTPRFLLIGDPRGLFNDNEHLNYDENTLQNHLLRTNYVVLDGDRLMRSTDCQTLFGEMQDSRCP